eukprot:40981-Amphidinium_carterae.1
MIYPHNAHHKRQQFLHNLRIRPHYNVAQACATFPDQNTHTCVRTYHTEHYIKYYFTAYIGYLFTPTPALTIR